MKITELGEEMTVAELREALEGLGDGTVVFLEFSETADLHGDETIWRDNRLSLCLRTEVEEVTP